MGEWKENITRIGVCFFTNKTTLPNLAVLLYIVAFFDGLCVPKPVSESVILIRKKHRPESGNGNLISQNRLQYRNSNVLEKYADQT